MVSELTQRVGQIGKHLQSLNVNLGKLLAGQMGMRGYAVIFKIPSV